MKELLKRWLEYFFEDYNKINKKLKLCTNSGKGSPCKKDCANKCKCVKEWITKKREEWQKINDNYLKKYKPVDDGSNNLNSFLETLLPQIPVVDDKGKHDSLEKLKKSFGCNCPENSEKECCKEGTPKDIVECLLHRLKKKATSCPSKPSDNQTQEQCQHPVLDEEPLEETEENPVDPPNICPTQPPPKQEDESGCKPASPAVPEKKEEKAPAPSIPRPPVQPPPSDEPFDSTILQIGEQKKWVKQKKEQEWLQIKKHFYKQEDIVKEVGPIKLTHDGVLEGVLNKEVLLTSLREGYGNANEIKHIEALLEKENEINQAEEVTGGVVGGKDNTTIDKLLNHEEKEAKDCLEKHNNCPPKPASPEGPGRADLGRSNTGPSSPRPAGGGGAHDNAATDPTDDQDSEEDEDEDEVAEDLGGHDDNGDDHTQETEEPQEEEVAPKEEVETVNVCSIVGGILTGSGNLNDACTLKYAKNNSRLGWKCIPSGDKTGTGSDEKTTSSEGSESAGPTRQRRDTTSGESATSSDNKGGLCIPPRRRRLYVGKLEQWASDEATKRSTSPQTSTVSETPSQSSSSSSSPSSNLRDDTALRDAFIQSAAIETFFLWDRYKKEKEKEEKEEQAQLVTNTSSVHEKPQNKLEKGEIPDGFLRQMFYTLGDYRDICVGVKQDVIKALEASGDNNIETINNKIKTILNGDTSPPTPPGTPSAQTPDKWWKTNGQHIWKGMICALTYKENGSGGDGKTTTITQDTNLKEQLLENGKNTPKNPRYQYNSVKLDDTSGAKSTQPPTSGDNTPKLSDFVLRPTYFRYLEEWGENFCKERKKRLAQIKVDCEVHEKGNRGCSGDGLKCNDPVPDNKDIFKDFECPSCGKSCRSYRKWIERKGNEFIKQKDRYQTEISDVHNNNDNGFCGRLKTTCILLYIFFYVRGIRMLFYIFMFENTYFFYIYIILCYK
ncbi:hypothetical protein PFTANZ_01661 [Plasmodium falciparum Tanzania (2000708)]|uniref:Duffy-binding-like domain-containing protein n=1 Tax=Plasmodium falciparum Tanzania (2000708) TaxID=1036725 RepID=A0A024WAL9_PLAFA|nr:hypothetical protein PFTANZ_01661 [Plasmodium falciparum Tanzania (2000708)]